MMHAEIPHLISDTYSKKKTLLLNHMLHFTCNLLETKYSVGTDPVYLEGRAGAIFLKGPLWEIHMKHGFGAYRGYT